MKNILNKTFDKIYVFNLDRRNDRWEDCKKIIDSTGLQLERMSAVDGETLKEEDLVMGLLDYIPKINLRGAQGCAMSQYNAIKKAKEEGHKNVYAVKECLYDFVLSLFDVKVTGTPVDVALAQAQPNMKNCYTLFPSVVTQRRGYSDIVCRDTNYKPYII